ncbi:hypothetical protein K3177_10000 [Qipengyuania sp. GH25]|uniref:Integrase n=1 Tax=Qipengyuania pacifica TaxID=2860199 RepID=A0ABS7JFQ0_9SPHN|nr:hypothetical protein [Qipengyuania aerophila]MBX7488845.1 hypothetical protein [Qipengyuania aerophila]
MNDKPALVPAGIDHDDHLAAMPYAERLKHHRKEIQAILPRQGTEGLDAYVARYPEAKNVRVLSQHRAFLNKPSGYVDEVSKLVSQWFASAEAVGQTNVDDVKRLNTKLGTSFPTANHFNARLSAGARKRIADVFRSNGAHYDPDRMSCLSKVREAVKHARQNAQADRAEFGSIGHRTATSLLLGDHRFTIERNGQRECIRPRIDGSKRRIYLDDILWIADLLNDEGVLGVSPLALRSKLVERAYSEKITPEPPQSTPTDSPSIERLGLSERIARLRDAYTRAPASADGDDPLANP